MLTRKQAKAIHNFRWQLSNTSSNEQMQWLLHSLLVIGRQPHYSEAGFVLPTVAMVSVVIVLLTTALLIRSFDRSKNASNVRVNQAVLNAAAPALDRARAKLDFLLAGNDPTLPRGTPLDRNLYKALNTNRYTFGDETRLKIVHDINGDGTIQTQPGALYVLEDDETSTSVWKFAVDTDNNGKFDSYTLYSIYFRSPTRDQTTGLFNRARNPLEARTPPMSGNIGGQCQKVTQTSASLIGDSSWYKTGARLTKSFFVYTATVPITDLTNVIPAQGQTIEQYEQYKGNKGFSALEFQQDRSRIPLINNAALFQDDLEITPGTNFRLNGRVFTNANLLIGGHGGATVRLYQVSSKDSCFYNEENSKVRVGGNVGTGNAYDTADQTAVDVDLFNGFGNSPSSATIDNGNRSTNSPGGSQVAYNNVDFNERIASMKQAALSKHAGFNSTTGIIDPPPTVISVLTVSDYPPEVKEGFKAHVEAPGGSSLNAHDVLAEQIELYLKERSIRVPYAQVSDIVAAFSSTAGFTAGIEPPAEWREPTQANTNLNLDTANLQQTQPEQQRDDGVETYLGDRINVGNNLPAYWKNDGRYVTGPRELQFLGTNINWTAPNTQPRYRTTQMIALPGVGESNRSSFWEDAAAQKPINNLSSVGGLRVITGAGVYVDDDSTTLGTSSYERSTYSFLPPPTWDSIVTDPSLIPKFTTALISSNNDNIVVWPDSMPMTGGAEEIAGANRKGDLQMRATAVYHYRSPAYTDSDYINRTPTACVSSYYDPTNSSMARNPLGLPDVSGLVSGTQPAVGVGRSNNGVVYPAPYNNDADRVTAVSTFRTKLNRQAQLVFPDGRIVNQPLRDALKKIDATGIRSLVDNSTLDTAICALKILDQPTYLPSPTPALPNGAIKEASFLDARQVKAIDKTATNYDLELEQRQPLEVRVTDINMGVLAGTNLGGTPTEFLLPNSGIIYASRDDALPDLSNTTVEKELLSPIDFILDPTRRAHGIRLINGSDLSRDDNYRQEEKGLILVTNLPAYIRGNFNLHYQPGTTTAIEEFTDTLESNWSDFYTRSTLNNQFACRKLQPGCGSTGDQWRLASIISDAITLLTNNFTDGFREQGDYDLRNNAGSSVTAARKHKGFWDNNFTTSANWAGADSYPSSRNSYQTNGVTPIQRRVNDFPEYIMEVCRVMPASECKAQDWVVGFDFNGNGDLNDSVNFDVNGDGLTNINDKEIGIKAWELGRALATAVPVQTLNPARLGAGTTATVALFESDRRYARRVAFARNQFHALVFTQIGTGINAKETAKPLGVGCPLDATGATPQNNGCRYPDSATRTPGNHYGTAADNALWFRTTNNITGEPELVANITYAADRPLYYLSPTQGGNKLMLPPTPEIAGVASLNLPVGNPASSYTICTDSQGSSALYTISQTVTLEMGDCDDQPGNPLAQITAAVDNLIALAPAASNTDTIVTPTQAGTFTAGTTTTLTQTGRVNVVTVGNLPTSNLAYTTIKLVGNENSIFVLRKSGGMDFGGGSGHYGVSLELNGVEPNNVFWSTDGDMKWNAVNPTTPHRLAGTFLSKGTGSPKWETLILDGGRILGVNVVPSASNYPSDTRIYAMSSNGQPSLVPVLQIHSPEGVPSAGTNLDQGGAEMKGKWLQLAGDDLTINAVFISGNSPSRPTEDSAGLHNFLRLQQNWDGRTINVKGGFIQFRQSAYATAPFTSVLAAMTDLNDGSLSIFEYPFTKYNAGGIPSGTLPYYAAATRQWGFDVGILSQSPDLFGQRFTQQPTTPADEFLREVSRDDIWVQRLLCAAQKSDPTINTYDHYAIDTSEQPTTNCPAFASYNN